MNFPLPGVGRTTLAVAGVMVIALAYPWRTTGDQWALGVATAMLVILTAAWRGMYLTTVLRRRLALVVRGRRSIGAHQQVDHTTTDARTTVVLRVLDDSGRDLPLSLIASYLDRYGVRCDSVRVTSCDTARGRTTWIGLTMSAAANLAALQARSSTLPLRQTAEITLRRLADELRELGCMPNMTDLAVPDLLGPQVKEGWRAVADAGRGYVAGYRIVGEPLADVLTALWAEPHEELWTAIEFRSTGVCARCAIRTPARPAGLPPVPGLAPLFGDQWRALAGLIPTSTTPLDVRTGVVTDVTAVRWQATSVPVAT